MGHDSQVPHKMLTFPKKIKIPYDEDASIKNSFSPVLMKIITLSVTVQKPNST